MEKTKKTEKIAEHIELPEYADEEALERVIDEAGLRRIRYRYLNRDSEGEITETPAERFYKIASAIAAVEQTYGAGNDDVAEWTRKFYHCMASADFFPGGRIISNVASSIKSLFNCYVLPVPDDLGGIYEQVRNAAVIHKNGGGTGYNFSCLRPRGMYVKKSQGLASGPVSFIGQFDKETEIINSGNRRGANMGILTVTHPDIFDFIHAKPTEGKLTNFNVSVGITDAFMEAMERDDYYMLEYPEGTAFKADLLEKIIRNIKNNMGGAEVGARPVPASLDFQGHTVVDTYNNEEVGRINERGEVELKASSVFERIAWFAHQTGDPGIIFMDNINRDNPFPEKGRITATNPCGEQPLHPYDACNLGSLNLAHHVIEENGSAEVDWANLKKNTELAVRMLDNCNDLNRGPIPAIEETVTKHRRVGLGVMGWADMLALLEISYDSEEALHLAEKVMKTISGTARAYSEKLAQEKGPFPDYEESIYGKNKEKKLRNVQRTTIAPTGTISMVAGCNSGIEPYFAVVYRKRMRGGDEEEVVVDALKKALNKRNIDIDSVKEKIDVNHGSVQGLGDIPEDVQKIFKTAHEIPYEWHIKMQAAFQKHVDNAVSKTINLPHNAEVDDVKHAYISAWRRGCKGITIYRDRSRSIQVLETSGEKPPKIYYKHISLNHRRIRRTPGTLGMEHYEIVRPKERDTLHVILEPKLFQKAEDDYYELIHAIWQSVKPIGTEKAAEFAQSGIDRSKGILQASDPDWAEFVGDLKSVRGDRSEGMGPHRIDSRSHAVSLCLEHALLSRGLIGYNERNELINLVRKSELKSVPEDEADEIYEKWIFSEKQTTEEGEMLPLAGRRFGIQFKCRECGATEYHMEAGCHDPVCNECGWSRGECD